MDPEYQRRGAGSMLVKWGTAIADEMGVDVSRSFSLVTLFNAILDVMG